MNIKLFTFNPFQENTYVAYDESKECIIIDPGCYNAQEEEELKRFINEEGLKPVKLINTHCHIDHILGNQFVSEEWDLELYIHKLDVKLVEKSSEIANIYGFKEYKKSPFPRHFLEDKDTLNFGNSNFEILFTPGHAPGHICLYNKEANIIISGDVIFQGSIGRTDLPGGDHKTLINSITTKLLPLADSTQIFCGHGPSTNLAYEKKNNPYLQ
tara:strand:- start:2260 stop:2898 length:639 start_codon:yes stop_codon:yes gene_type:complete